MSIVFNILLYIDGAIYNLVDYLYDIFEALAKANLFQEDTYRAIVNRIYIVLGMIMLFILAYSLLKAVIDPDSFAKGESSFPKIIQNLIVSLIIIVVLPTVFTVAYNIQNSILNYDTIPKLILGSEYELQINGDGAIRSPGKRMAYYTFTSFFHENEEWCNNQGEKYKVDPTTGVGLSECANMINGNGWIFFQNGPTLASMTKGVLDQDKSFTAFSKYGEAIADEGSVDYMPLISTVAGIFVAYILLNFCFDMAVRVVKLMFFQIIAPVPVICRILPGGKMKDVFSTWVKKTTSTFIDVFLRIAILYLGVLLINEIIRNFGSIASFQNPRLSFTQVLLAKALLIMGVVMFIKEAPKLLSEMFHLDTGSMSLGIRNKLAQGGGLLAGAAIGGGATMFGRNAVNAFKNIGAAKGGWNKFKAGVRGAGSSIAGAASGSVRSGWNGRGAKSFGDVKSAASKGAATALEKREKRAAYKASHRIPIAGHVFDAAKSVGEFWGVGSGLEALQKEQAIYQEGMKFKKDLFDLVEDDTTVRQYTGLLKSAQEMDVDAYAKEMGITRQEAILEQRERIDKYDSAVKIASMAAVQKKLDDKHDARATNIYAAFETFKKQHSDIAAIAELNLTGLSASEVEKINVALTSDDINSIKAAKTQLDERIGSLMQVDNKFKSLNGEVQGKINQKIQEKKAEGK